MVSTILISIGLLSVAIIFMGIRQSFKNTENRMSLIESFNNATYEARDKKQPQRKLVCKR